MMAQEGIQGRRTSGTGASSPTVTGSIHPELQNSKLHNLVTFYSHQASQRVPFSPPSSSSSCSSSSFALSTVRSHKNLHIQLAGQASSVPLAHARHPPLHLSQLSKQRWHSLNLSLSLRVRAGKLGRKTESFIVRHGSCSTSTRSTSSPTSNPRLSPYCLRLTTSSARTVPTPLAHPPATSTTPSANINQLKRQLANPPLLGVRAGVETARGGGERDLRAAPGLWRN